MSENEKKIRILQVNKYYYPWIGGIETVIRQISEGIKDESDVSVLVCRDLKTPPKERRKTVQEEISGVKVLRTGSLGEVAKVPVSFSFITKFRSLAKENDIVQIHVPFPLADLACLLSGYKGKVVVWWHSDVVRQKKWLVLYKPVMDRLLKRADLIIVSADGVAKGSRYLKPYLNKCKTIHFGLEKRKYDLATDFLKARNALKKSENVISEQTDDLKINGEDNRREISSGIKENSIEKNLELLFMGRLVYYKGCSILLEALSQVRGRVHLTMIGSGQLENALREQCEKLGLVDKVEFTGTLPEAEIPAYFENADVFVLPSTERSEAFALVQLEAMAYGIPVINTKLESGVPEVSIHGETGLTVKPEDVKELAEAIQWMVDNPVKREELGKKARKRLEEEFTEEKMISEVMETYRELMSEN